MTETLTATEAAKRARADIKTAAKNGELEAHPAGVTFSVRREYASQMSEINVTIKGAPEDWALIRLDDACGPRALPSASVRLLAHALRGIVARHYQADGCHRFISIDLQHGEDIYNVL
jgi:hypothetical protein